MQDSRPVLLESELARAKLKQEVACEAAVGDPRRCAASLVEPLRSVVRTSDLIALGVSQLKLDQIRMPTLFQISCYLRLLAQLSKTAQCRSPGAVTVGMDEGLRGNSHRCHIIGENIGKSLLGF
jgi:hypothetical protein